MHRYERNSSYKWLLPVVQIELKKLDISPEKPMQANWWDIKQKNLAMAMVILLMCFITNLFIVSNRSNTYTVAYNKIPTFSI